MPIGTEKSFLGIDVGTSKVAVVALAPDGKAAFHASHPTDAAITAGPRAEQNPAKIIETVRRCVSEVPRKLLAGTASIGITGQMHGVLLWNSEEQTTPLVTWQDHRASDAELELFRERTGDISLQHGFGAVTLMWLQRHTPELLEQYKYASTIHDFLAAILCRGAARTDPTNAASWGLFDLRSLNWDTKAVIRSEVPGRIFPSVEPTGAVIGRLEDPNFIALGLAAGTPIVNAIGDNQASLLATITDSDSEVALTLGTGGQLSVALSSFPRGNLAPSVDVRPWVEGKYIAVAASLCGGKSFAWLRESIRSWCAALGIEAPADSQLYATLNRLGLESMNSPLNVCSSFLGERHDPKRRGSISNIDLDNFTLGNLASAIVRDTIENLSRMMPREFLAQRKRIVGSGNGLRQLPLAQRWVERTFDIPLKLIELQEEAAIGAAMLASRSTP